MCDVTPANIRYYLKKFGIRRPWQEENRLRKMYESGMTIQDIANEFGVDYRTVWQYMNKYGIRRRKKWEHSYAKIPNFRTDTQGYERWESGDEQIYVHRLLAVSEFGLEAIKEKDIHHKSEVPWDNRPGNIEPLTRSEHKKTHSQQ